MPEVQENLTQSTINSKYIDDIKEMVNKSNCEGTEKQELLDLFMEFQDRFLPKFVMSAKAGNSTFQPHKIILEHDKPIWIPQFRQSEKKKQIIEETTQSQFKGGVIEKSTSPYNSPCMCVPKKDGGWHPVIDYRVINDITIKEQWPMTRSDEAYDALSKAKYMTKLDCYPQKAIYTLHLQPILEDGSILLYLWELQMQLLHSKRIWKYYSQDCFGRVLLYILMISLYTVILLKSISNTSEKCWRG